MSRRQDIVDAIETRLKTITTGGGYSTQIGSKVYPWRKTAVQVSEVPCLCFWDQQADVEFEGRAIGTRQHNLAVEVVVFVKSATTAAQARAALQDVVAAIGTDDTLGGLADRCELTAHELTMEVDGDICGAGRIAFTVQYTTTLWNT